jgi:hypothetical protein
MRIQQDGQVQFGLLGHRAQLPTHDDISQQRHKQQTQDGQSILAPPNRYEDGEHENEHEGNESAT